MGLSDTGNGLASISEIEYGSVKNSQLLTRNQI